MREKDLTRHSSPKSGRGQMKMERNSGWISRPKISRLCGHWSANFTNEPANFEGRWRTSTIAEDFSGQSGAPVVRTWESRAGHLAPTESRRRSPATGYLLHREAQFKRTLERQVLLSAKQNARPAQVHNGSVVPDKPVLGAIDHRTVDGLTRVAINQGLSGPRTILAGRQTRKEIADLGQNEGHHVTRNIASETSRAFMVHPELTPRKFESGSERFDLAGRRCIGDRPSAQGIQQPGGAAIVSTAAHGDVEKIVRNLHIRKEMAELNFQTLRPSLACQDWVVPWCHLRISRLPPQWTPF